MNRTNIMDVDAVINLVLFGVLVVGAFIGYAKGLLQQAIELLGIVAAFIVATMLAGRVADYLETRLDSSYSLALVVSFVILVGIGIVASHFIAVGAGRVIKMTILGFVDRLSGALLGLLMAMIVSSLLITVTLELPFPKPFHRRVASSSMGLFLRPVAGQVFNWLTARAPGDIRFEDFFRRGKTV